MVVQHLLELPEKNLYWTLSDSRCALQLLQKDDTGFLFARVLADTAVYERVLGGRCASSGTRHTVLYQSMREQML